MSQDIKEGPIEFEICMVSTCLSLSIISTAIIGLLSKFSISVPIILIVFVNSIAVLSAYGALWTLACSCCGSNSAYGFSEIRSLLTKPSIYKPYWIIGWTLLFWLIISCLIGSLI